MVGETDLSILLKNMKPIHNEGEYVFCCMPHESTIDLQAIHLFFKEKEGITVIFEKTYADTHGFSYPSVCAWLTLLIHSSLEAVGLTAAFSNALAEDNIPCNVVAGYYHDHLFVPLEKVEKAIDILKRLSMTQLIEEKP